jgi:hypothetical protein
MDTQIGTRPQIGALEIHQAYILASLNWLQQLVSFTETEIRVIPRSIDPFVFQVTPIGVVIYSKWGEEASDAIFDNVKPL